MFLAKCFDDLANGVGLNKIGAILPNALMSIPELFMHGSWFLQSSF